MPAARSSTRALVLGLAALAAAGDALAGSGALAINAVVLSNNNCTFRGATPAINVPVDAASAGGQSASASWTMRCSGGSGTASWGMTASLGLYPSGGVRQMRHSTDISEFLAYTLSFPASGTIARNTDTPFTITATVAPGAFQNALPGSYSDTVTLTISP